MEGREKVGRKGHFRTVILLSFHLFFLWLLVSGNSKHYLAPHMAPFLYFAAGAFLLLTIVQFKKGRGKEAQAENCHCREDHHHTHGSTPMKKVRSYGIILVPLVLGVFVPYQVPGSALAAQKGAQIGTITLKSKSGTEDKALKIAAEGMKHEDIITVNDNNYMLVLSVLNEYPGEFNGKKIKIQGMVFVDPESPYKGKALGRMVITCCFADATFYGIPILSTLTANDKQDTWVSIEGTINTITVNEEKIAGVQAEKSEQIGIPSNPYITPSF